MLHLLLPLVLALQQVERPPAALVSAPGGLRVDGASYTASLAASGLAFGGSDDAPALTLGAVELRRGAARVALAGATPRTVDGRVELERAPGVVERFQPTNAGVEHSLVVTSPIGGDGDLVVRLELGGANASSGERLADGTHRFGDVGYGRLFGIDADGDRVDGDVRLVPGGLELVLPDAFVDAATWPITLDPLISNGVEVSSPASFIVPLETGESDIESDCVYDASTGWHLRVWRRRITEEIDGPLGTTQIVTRDRVLYRRLTSTGSPVGTELQISNNNSYEPRVASVNRHDTFVVTWLEDVADETRLMCRVYDASTGVATSSAITLATDDEGEIRYHDVAGESSPSIFVAGRAYVVWIDGSGALKLTRVNAPSSGAPTIVDTTTLAADPGLFDSWQYVSVARCTNSEGRLVAAVGRLGTLSGASRVQALTFDRNAAVLTAPLTVSGADVDALNPSVDGGGSAPSRWVVAWDEGFTTPFGAAYELHAAALAVSSSGANTMTAAPVATLTDSDSEHRPSVGWRPGMAVIAYERDLDVEVLMACDKTAQIGEPASVVFDGNIGTFSTTSGSRSSVALRTSGGNTTEHEGLVHWSRSAASVVSVDTSLWMRRYDAFDPNATASIVAFGCGNVGAIGVNSVPAIGNPDFGVTLTGANPTAAIAILNLAAPQPLSTCGACSFAPLQTLTILPIVAGEAAVALPVPCNPALAGAQADVQWIVYELGVTPCAPVPDFGATAILRLTVN